MYSLYIWNHPSLFIVTNLGQELWTWKEKTWGFPFFAQDSSPYSFLMIPLYFQRFKHGIWTSACVICSWSSSINHQTVRTCFVPHKHLRCSCCCVWDRLITVFCLLWDVYLSRSSFFFFESVFPSFLIFLFLCWVKQLQVGIAKPLVRGGKITGKIPHTPPLDLFLLQLCA